MRRSPRLALAGFACFLLLGACTGGVDQDAIADDPVPDNSESDNSPSEDAESDGAGSTTEPPDPPEANSDGGADTDGSDTEPVELSTLADLAGQILLRDGDGQIAIAQPDASATVVLSEPGADHTQPTWSGSGDLVAWSSFSAGGSTLSVSDRDGSAVSERSVRSPAFYLSWSPNDSWIGGLRPGPEGMEMFIADGANTEDRSISSAAPFYFEWAGNDDIVAALANQLLVDIAADNTVDPLRRPLELPLGIFQAPAVLPNGQVVAALRENGLNTLVRLSGAQAETIATANGPFFIAASPDGTKVAVLTAPSVGGAQQEPEITEIAFQFDEPVELGDGSVTIIDLETGDVTEQAEEQVVAISWSPDSSTLALLRFDDNQLRWSFATDSETIEGAAFAPSPRFTQRYLPFFDQYNLSSTAWSPDSEAIVFAGEVAGDSGVFVDLVFDDAGPARVSEGDIAFWSPN